MGSPFLYSCDLWILSYVEEQWSAARRHPYPVDYILESAPTRPRVVSIPIHFVGSDDAATAAEHAVPIAISQNEISAVAEEGKDPISEEVEKSNGRDFEAEEVEERTEEDESFVMVAEEEEISFFLTDTESESDSASESSDGETSEEATEDSTVASGMQQILKKVMAASDRLQGWCRGGGDGEKAS